MAHEYSYGATLETMALLPALDIRSSPRSGYRPFTTTVRLGDGKLQGLGFPVVTWHFTFVTMAERDVFVDDPDDPLSKNVYIRSRLPDGTWATFSCIQNRPTGEEDFQAQKILGFDIEFTHCVLIPDEE
jgi:hypothetical protein